MPSDLGSNSPAWNCLTWLSSYHSTRLRFLKDQNLQKYRRENLNPRHRKLRSLTRYRCSLPFVRRYVVDLRFLLEMLAPLQRFLHQFPHQKFRRRQHFPFHEELQRDVWYSHLRCRPSHCLEMWRGHQEPLAVALATPVCTAATTAASATTRPRPQRWTTLMMTAPGNTLYCGTDLGEFRKAPCLPDHPAVAVHVSLDRFGWNSVC